MRSAIIYGTYTILNIIALFLVDHWLCRASEKHQNSVAGRVIVDFLYVVLAFMPILATIIKDSIYKYFLLRYSYIWMGFLMYFGGMLLFPTVVEVIVRCVKHAKQKKREKEGYSLSEEEIERNAARSRHVTAFVFCMIILVTIGLNVYGMIHARNTVVTHYSVEIDKKGARELARRSRGTPRLANRLLKRVRDYAQIRYGGKITYAAANEALDLLDVDKYGLDQTDRNILMAIMDTFSGGPVGLDTLSAALGEDRGTLEEVYEPFLIKSGLLQRTPRGRVVTERAKAYLQ